MQNFYISENRDISKHSPSTLLASEVEGSLEENERGEGITNVKKQGQIQERESEQGLGDISAHEATNYLDTTPTAHMDDVENTGDISMKKVGVSFPFGDNSENFEAYHKVWRPKKPSIQCKLVRNTMKLREQQCKFNIYTIPPPLEQSSSRTTIFLRQQQLLDRVQATQVVLKESTVGSPGAQKPIISFKEASRRIISNQRKQTKGHINLSDIVTQYMTNTGRGREALSNAVPHTSGTSTWHSSATEQRSLQRKLTEPISIDEWHKLVGENQTSHLSQ